MNWFEGGRLDGAKGIGTQTFQEYSQACLKHGIQASEIEYLKGRKTGLNKFCTYESGLNHGSSGNTYKNVCPDHLKGGFLKGYRLGKRKYELDQKEIEIIRRQNELQQQSINLENKRIQEEILDQHNKLLQEQQNQIHQQHINTHKKATP